ncbi:hypothetical protein [Synechococcus sp. LTW-R]|nr:hypothetical protein [Synechococcus sp. LTW-R]QNG29597.1 hypothetical protein H0O22_13045 [Synechococcus sp. LTW-R]
MEDNERKVKVRTKKKEQEGKKKEGGPERKKERLKNKRGKGHETSRE